MYRHWDSRNVRSTRGLIEPANKLREKGLDPAKLFSSNGGLKFGTASSKYRSWQLIRH